MAMQIYSGWPYDGAITDNAEPTASEGILAGMAIKKDSTTGKLVLADGTVGEVSFFALKDQDDTDVVFSKSLPYIVKNATVYTDQYVADTYSINDPICVSTGIGHAEDGLYRKYVDGVDTAPVVGYYDGSRTFDSVVFIKIRFKD